MENTPIPEAERAFMDEVATAAQGLYAAVGTPRPFAVIKPGDGAMLVLSLPGLAGTETSKYNAINSVRHHTLRLTSPMSALVVETWSVAMEENTERELIALQKRGKGIGDHPRAVELVLITMESEQGRATHSFTIDRRHEDMTMLAPRDDMQFNTWAELDLRSEGYQRLADFHTKLRDRINPEVLEWAKLMDETYGDPRKAQLQPATASRSAPTEH